MKVSQRSVVAVYAVATAERLGCPLDRLVAIRAFVEQDADVRLNAREHACVEAARTFVEKGRLDSQGEVERALLEVSAVITPLDTGRLQAP